MYLEIIAPDYDHSPTGGVRPFGLDRLGSSGLVGWAANASGLDAPRNLSRFKLHRYIAKPEAADLAPPCLAGPNGLSSRNSTCGHNLARLQSGGLRLLRESLNQIRNCTQRAPEYVRPAPGFPKLFIAIEANFECLKRVNEVGAEMFHAMLFANQQRSVQGAVYDGIGRLKAPSWKMRLHDFEGMRYPVNALKDFVYIVGNGWLGPKVNDDLGL